MFEDNLQIRWIAVITKCACLCLCWEKYKADTIKIHFHLCFIELYRHVAWYQRKKTLFITVHFTAFDKAQITPLGVTKCVHLSENKICSEICC